MAPASRKGKRAVDQDTGTSKKRQQQKQAQRDADTADDSDELLSFNDIVQFVTEFLEVAFNTILYLRQVYPPHVFAKAKKYETPIWRARVPILQSYLGDAARAVGEQLSTGSVKQVCLTIRSVRTQRFLETFLFDFTYLGVTPLFFASTTDKNTKIAGSPTRGQLALILRGLLIKLCVTEGQLNGYPEEETTFDIGIKMHDDFERDPTMNDRAKGNEPMWIPAQVDEDKMVNIPIRTAVMGVMSMQLFVQENTSKADSTAPSGSTSD